MDAVGGHLGRGDGRFWVRGKAEARFNAVTCVLFLVPSLAFLLGIAAVYSAFYPRIWPRGGRNFGRLSVRSRVKPHPLDHLRPFCWLARGSSGHSHASPADPYAVVPPVFLERDLSALDMNDYSSCLALLLLHTALYHRARLDSRAPKRLPHEPRATLFVVLMMRGCQVYL
ncbi:hypothetical protein MSAN_02415700 [Mycena sanguinolenta]|uniref:Uncharacterized protein n=1 Tax=Mycena sanguinolenta TaxID=230812 RepID=A0A8H7CF11_9AGAR|nr:hypothetical protein MSAN_02415700 [Mycena sanguinolenta]